MRIRVRWPTVQNQFSDDVLQQWRQRKKEKPQDTTLLCVSHSVCSSSHLPSEVSSSDNKKKQETCTGAPSTKGRDIACAVFWPLPMAVLAQVPLAREHSLKFTEHSGNRDQAKGMPLILRTLAGEKGH